MVPSSRGPGHQQSWIVNREHILYLSLSKRLFKIFWSFENSYYVARTFAQVHPLGTTKNAEVLRVQRVCQELQSGAILLTNFLFVAEDKTLLSQTGCHHSRPSHRMSPSIFVLAAFVSRSEGGWLHVWAHMDASCHTECASLSPVTYISSLPCGEEPWLQEVQVARMVVCLPLTLLLLLCRHPERCLEQAFAQKTQEPEATHLSVSFSHIYHGP